MSYLRHLCLFAYSGVQHILCCVFVLLVFVLSLLPVFPDCPFLIEHIQLVLLLRTNDTNMTRASLTTSLQSLTYCFQQVKPIIMFNYKIWLVILNINVWFIKQNNHIINTFKVWEMWIIFLYSSADTEICVINYPGSWQNITEFSTFFIT
jgi:hypothetical protein